MHQLFATMSEGNCGVLAGIVPIFLIAQIAERFVTRGRRTFTSSVALVSRASAIVVTSVGFAILEIVLIEGMSDGGYTGVAAKNWWTLFVGLFFIVIATYVVGALASIFMEVWKTPLPAFIVRRYPGLSEPSTSADRAAERRLRYRVARKR